jgi:hypothetical protein
LSKECFNIKLRSWKFCAKALNIDDARFSGVLFVRIIWNFALDLFKAFRASNVEENAVSQGIDNVRIVELPHPAEFVDQGDFNRQIVDAISLLVEKIIIAQIGITKIEVDLIRKKP